MAELMEYVDRMYHTVTNKDVALEYSRTQISVLRKELDQNRVRSEGDRKSLTGTRPHSHTIFIALIRETLKGNVGLTLGMLYVCGF